MKYFYLVLISLLAFQQASSQSLEPYNRRNVLRFGYGLAVSGRGDIPGHQLMIGVQNQLSRHSLLDVRLSVNSFEQSRTWHQAYTVIDKSKGISLEADYGWALQWKRLMVYPSIGPALRFSHEIHPSYISIAYDPKSGSIINFEAPSTDKHVLRVGATGGLNVDVRIFKSLSIGLRASMQGYKSGDTIQFYGFTLKNNAWRF